MEAKITEKKLEELCITTPVDVVLEVLLRKHLLNAPNFDLFKCIYKGQGYDIEIRKFEKKSSLDMLNELKEENQALKDRWDRLAQFVWEQLNNENFDKYKAFDEMMSKMQELEKEIK